jgi:hypothetical protein
MQSSYRQIFVFLSGPPEEACRNPELKEQNGKKKIFFALQFNEMDEKVKALYLLKESFCFPPNCHVEKEK